MLEAARDWNDFLALGRTGHCVPQIGHRCQVLGLRARGHYDKSLAR